MNKHCLTIISGIILVSLLVLFSGGDKELAMIAALFFPIYYYAVMRGK